MNEPKNWEEKYIHFEEKKPVMKTMLENKQTKHLTRKEWHSVREIIWFSFCCLFLHYNEQGRNFHREEKSKNKQ